MKIPNDRVRKLIEFHSKAGQYQDVNRLAIEWIREEYVFVLGASHMRTKNGGDRES